jgi:hypothetical protein
LASILINISQVYIWGRNSIKKQILRLLQLCLLAFFLVLLPLLFPKSPASLTNAQFMREAAIHAFGEYTIPTRLRLGWFFGSDRFESEGEFFRCSINNAIYR